jgi:RNA polymerase sigma-70 factor (ECF subfamily)
MPVKSDTSSMLGATALAIDGLRLSHETARADDLELIERVRRGEPGSREGLYHRYKRRVFALAVRIVGAMDAEEVTQEAFIRIFRGLPKFRGEAALGTWVYRLAVNAALSHRARRATGGTPPAGTGELAEHEAAPAAVPAGDAVLRARLERALWRLPVGYRTVIVLHDVEGLEHEEVASILGCHVGTSKSQLHKARARLRELLAADGITQSALEEG